MLLRKLPAILVLVSTVACAAGGAPAPTPRTILNDPSGEVLGTGTHITTVPNEGETAEALSMDADAAMQALLAGYAALGIEVTLVDPPNRRLGNPRFVANRTLLGESLRRFLSCGETMTADRAATDRIYLSLVSTVRPLPEGRSEVVTRLESVAVDHRSGNGGSTTPCRTTGALEGRLHSVARSSTVR